MREQQTHEYPWTWGYNFRERYLTAFRVCRDVKIIKFRDHGQIMAWGQTYAFHYFNSEDDKDTRKGKRPMSENNVVLSSVRNMHTMKVLSRKNDTEWLQRLK